MSPSSTKMSYQKSQLYLKGKLLFLTCSNTAPRFKKFKRSRSPKHSQKMQLEILNIPIPREQTHWKETLSDKILGDWDEGSEEEIKDKMSNNVSRSRADEVNKSQSCSSFFRQPETTLKEIENEECWGICRQPYEVHSFDHNIELITLAQKYNDIMNNLTKDGFNTLMGETYLSMTSQMSKMRFAGFDDGTPTFKAIKKLMNKQELLSRNINFTSMNSSISPYRTDIMKSIVDDLKSKDAPSNSERIEKIKLHHRTMVEKAIKYYGITPMISRLDKREICSICLCKIQKLIQLNCNHSFWEGCIEEYLELKIYNPFCLDIHCPELKCKVVVHQNIIFQCCSRALKSQYRDFYKNLIVVKNCRNFMFCLTCNQLLKINNEDLLVVCDFWSLEIWSEWITPWHYGKSCHEQLEDQYNKYALGKEIQLWPKCGGFMEKAQEWNHLAWPRWMSSFCIYCRNQFSENHLNPLDAKACTQLLSAQKSTAIMRTPFQDTGMWRLLILLMLYFLLFPLVLFVFLPIIIILGIKNEVKLKKKKLYKKLFSILCSSIWTTLAVLLFPLAIWKLMMIQNLDHSK